MCCSTLSNNQTKYNEVAISVLTVPLKHFELHYSTPGTKRNGGGWGWGVILPRKAKTLFTLRGMGMGRGKECVMFVYSFGGKKL